MATSHRTWARRSVGVLVILSVILAAVFLTKGKSRAHHSSVSSSKVVSTPSTSTLSDNIETPANPITEHDATVNGAVASPVTTVSGSTSKSSGQDLTFTSNNQPQKGIVSTQGQKVCSVANTADLIAAVQNGNCPVIRLTSIQDGAYVLHEEIIISRAVVIQGIKALLPLIDGSDAVRCFHVKSGASLTLQYLRLANGKGILRTVGGRQILEIKGGGVLFEPGAVSGLFVGVFFLGEQSLQESERNIQRTLSLTGGRIYGGSIFMAGGSLTSIGCLFLRSAAFIPLTDWLFFGGDVLVIAGEATFSGCFFAYITAIGLTNGLGSAVAMFGGVTIFTLCNVLETLLAGGFNGMGQAFWVGGGVQVITGCHFSYYQALMLLAGTGDLTVSAGVQIITGTAVETAYGLAAAFGVGLGICTLAGLTVQTGLSMRQWSGGFYSANAGGFTYVGAGEMVFIGGEVVATNGVGAEAGLGGYYAVATGIAIFIGVPSFDIVGLWAVTILGEFLGVGSGLVVWIGVNTFKLKGMEGFAGKGGVMFVGLGVAVLGYSQLIERIGLVNEHTDFWIGGACEPYEGAWAGGPLFFVKPGDGGRPGCTTPPNSNITTPPGQFKGTARRLASLPKDIQLVAMNMDRTHDWGEPSSTSPQTLKMAQDYDQALQPFHAYLASLNGSSSKGNSLQFYIGEDIAEGACTLCNVISVSGPGAQSCATSPDCTGVASPFGSEDAFKQTNGSSQYLVLTNLEPTTKANASLDPQGLSLAFKKTLVDLELLDGDEISQMQSLQVNTFSTQASEPFAHMYPDLVKDESSNDPDFPTSSHFQAVVVTTNKALASALASALGGGKPKKVRVLDEEPVEEDYEDEGDEEEEALGLTTNALESGIRNHLLDEQGVDLGQVGLSYVTTYKVPIMAKPSM